MDISTPSLPSNPIISVCVITYNHQEYIIECLEGIKNQHGAPPFEVIIRDDASNDNTESIVRSYLKDNGLSHFTYLKAEHNGGMMVNLTAALSLCRGEFVALCEGDDYWTDSAKLRKQYTLMKANPGCTISAHSCYISTPTGSNKKGFYHGEILRKFDLREILSNSSTQFAPTASYMIRTDIIDNLPDWFCSAPIGDLFLELLSLKQGHGLYMPDLMSAYRVFATGSWSSRMKNDHQYSIDYGNRMLKIISNLENDDLLMENGLDILKANVKALLASNFLLRGEFQVFRNHIEESFSLSNRHQSRTARCLYALRRLPLIASLLYRVKRAYFE